jgi:exosortase/archaeosortase
MRPLYVLLIAFSVVAALGSAFFVALPAHVRYTMDKDDYARAMASVAYCDTTDVTTMPVSHRQEHHKVCADSRDVLRRSPTLEAAVAYVLADYSARVVSGVSTWKFVMFAMVVCVVLVVGAVTVFDRYYMRRRAKPLSKDEKADIYGD